MSVVNCFFLFCFFKSQATDVAAEMKRKLEKKRKKQKKLQQQANGDTNGDAEVSSLTVEPACVDLRRAPPPSGPVSVYRMLQQHDSEPLAGPKPWTWPLKRVGHSVHALAT